MIKAEFIFFIASRLHFALITAYCLMLGPIWCVVSLFQLSCQCWCDVDHWTLRKIKLIGSILSHTPRVMQSWMIHFGINDMVINPSSWIQVANLWDSFSNSPVSVCLFIPSHTNRLLGSAKVLVSDSYTSSMFSSFRPVKLQFHYWAAPFFFLQKWWLWPHAQFTCAPVGIIVSNFPVLCLT